MNNRYREEEKENQTVEEILEEEKAKEENDLEKLKEENNKLKEQYLRNLADSENFKKRNDEERIRERKYVSQRLIEKLIDSIDMFDKVVNMNTEDEMLKNFLIGFQMINNNMKQVLSEEGVKKIEAVGKKFDPRYHEANETEWDESMEEDMIISEFRSGYMYKDRVLRASLVKVNKKIVNENNDK